MTRAVIDAHLHIFPRLGTASGGESAQLQLDLLQHHLSLGGAARRRSDGAWIENVVPRAASDSVRDLPRLQLRVADFGQVEFTIEGVDYYTQAFPPILQQTAAPPEHMIAEMDLAGVDTAVLQHDHIYGALNEFYAQAARRFPGRFVGLAQVREWEAHDHAQHDRLEYAVRELGMRGLYFSVEPFAIRDFADHLDDARFEPLWDRVRKLDISVWFYIHSRRRDRRAAYLQHVAELNRWAERHPDIPAVLTHGIDLFGAYFPLAWPSAFPAPTDEERYRIPDELMGLLERPNMHLEVLFHARWPEYPYPGAQDMIRRLRDELGPHKLMWGSDMPATWFWCTYRQAVDYIRLHCDFLSEQDKALLLGGNAARVLRLQEQQRPQLA